MFPFKHLGTGMSITTVQSLMGGFVYHNRAKLEGGFWHKEAQYPMKPAEAGSDLGGQREKGGGAPPTGRKKKMGTPGSPRSSRTEAPHEPKQFLAWPPKLRSTGTSHEGLMRG